jgi:hypothetical protein
MTRKAFEAQVELVQKLHGQKCCQVSIGEDDELIVDFGALVQVGPGDFDGESWLIAECPWRLEDADEVICGWDDTDEAIGDAIHEIIGATLQSTSVRRPGYDLTATFDTGETTLVLKFFPDCVAYFSDDAHTLSIPWYAGGKAVEVV